MRSRLAPSPTGALHLGNARTFLLNWLLVRSAGGALPLRIEDLDGPRVKPGAAAEALEDLRWLGLDFDGEPLLQSTRAPAHAAALHRLEAAGLLYPCVCTRAEIERAASAPQEGDGTAPYPGTCRGRFASAEEARAASGREPAWRFRVDPDREVAFEDGFRGPVRDRPARTCGDFVVAKRDGGAAYQLAVVVDDAFQGVDTVVRGDDLLPSTALQILLCGALGLPVPRHVHLPLVRGPDGRRLAKRHGDTRIARFREAGVPAERVVGLLAAWSGLGNGGEASAPDLLRRGFDLRAVPRGDVVLAAGAEERLLGGLRG
ncbi:MAG: tRNA glutamyl-Q(34) synthetase GluQRS [Planctomycetes bacterium]|nr:tRNA glutamyl-Q(34) synthetase GluQRS [Planctomycetota bacterium]